VIYLDHAATSFPKPPGVLEAVAQWYRDYGVSADRGDSARCAEVGRLVEDTRTRLARLCGVPSARIAFTSGATESLNLFLRGFLRPSARVLTTALEHSSVVRPLVALRDELGIHIEVVPCDAHGAIDAERIVERLAAQRFDLLAFTHASNVVGSVLDARTLCAAARANGCATLLDACQSAGLLPLDVGADALAASAHKSLLGPPGLGFLAVRDGVALRPAKQGGTGSARALERHPDEWPAAFQAGTPNTPAILGLRAALRWLDERRMDELLAHGLRCADALREELEERGGASVLGPPPGTAPRLAIVSFTLADLDPSEVGAMLADAGIHVRTGYHCAPWIHAPLGTAAAGTVRASFGPFVSADDVRAVARALSP
jgi:selenocysteine lyase/cysteine desulfurase